MRVFLRGNERRRRRRRRTPKGHTGESKGKKRTVRLCRKRWEKKETKKDSDGEIVCEERRDYVEIVRELGCRDCQCGGGGSLVELQTYIFFVKQGGRWEVKNPPSAQLWKLTDKLFCLD